MEGSWQIVDDVSRERLFDQAKQSPSIAANNLHEMLEQMALSIEDEYPMGERLVVLRMEVYRRGLEVVGGEDEDEEEEDGETGD